MTFGEKLKKLRTDKGMTQEELATHIFVSRTAVSKWESDRGYPSIESIKALARLFSVTVDELLSGDEILTIAEEDQKRTASVYRDLLYGFVDICICLLLFLPLFASKANGIIEASSLLALIGAEWYMKAAYYIVVISTVTFGILTLVLRSFTATVWMKGKTKISLTLGVIATLTFIISAQPYAAAFAFSMLVIKAVMLIKYV